ncbi:MAG: AraC family transcriptional regulator ligand-binding domain-containing protein [Alcanivoracaceae bacterium]|jgi:AraC-like DNA-binding protein|nr:AraC family transcriptional regulator ligand-binding domain-containing protein [Alcanivoracaceae bacterium]
MTIAAPLTASRYLAGVQQMLAEQGVAAGALLDGTGITQAVLDDVGGFVSADDQDRFLANAIRLSGDPMPGLRLGRRLNISAHGSAGFAGLTAANARAALQVAVRYFPLITELVSLQLEEGATVACVHVQPLPDLSERCEQFVIQTLFSSIALMAGFLLGPKAGGLQLDLPGDEDQALLDGLTELRDGVRFNTGRYCIQLPGTVLETPFALADARAHQLAIQRCERELTQLRDRTSFAERLYQQLLQTDDSMPTLEQLATQLQLSSRTLHRRLEGEGRRFRDLLNQARMTKAEQLLQRGWSITDIAHALGYGDSANFTRAFRRHHGVPPSRFHTDPGN